MDRGGELNPTSQHEVQNLNSECFDFYQYVFFSSVGALNGSGPDR